MDPLKIVAQVAAFQAALETLGQPQRAMGEKAYLKSDLDFYGAAVPEIRKLAKTFHKTHADLPRPHLMALVEALWQTRFHETRSLGIALLELYTDRLTPPDMALIEAILRQCHTWAHVDWLAIKVAGCLVARYPDLKSTLERWAIDENFWLRRSALLALHDSLKASGADFELFAQFAGQMIEEQEFFIRKAIGWILREISKRRPEEVYGFLVGHADRVSGLTLREGSKYLPPAQQEELMARYQARR
jgi:3-methyladenine DNA glycosylase AlkD